MNDMIRRYSFKGLLQCALLSMCMPVAMAQSQAFQSHQSIYQVAASHVRSHVASQHSQRPVITVGKLDSRLKLKLCSKSLLAYMPKGSRNIGKTTVGVKCTDSKPWSLHVPVTISVFKKILVASRVLQRDEVLTVSDVKFVKHDLASLPYGYFDNIESAIGMKLKRRSLEGAVLTPTMLKKPQVITRGQQISILAQSGRMAVRMSGKALSSGAIGDRIKVMNLKSNQKLEGVVTSSSEVKVDI